MIAPSEAPSHAERVAEVPSRAPAPRLSERTELLLQALCQDAERVVELLNTWDDDRSGTTDRREFRIARHAVIEPLFVLDGAKPL